MIVIAYKIRLLYRNNCIIIFSKTGSDISSGFSRSENNRGYCDLDFLWSLLFSPNILNHLFAVVKVVEDRQECG